MKRRPEVEAFANLMEKVLKKNDHKDGWWDCSIMYLFTRLVEEAGELGRALRIEQDYGLESFDKIQKEAADVGNFAMMIACVCGRMKIKKVENKARRVEVELFADIMEETMEWYNHTWWQESSGIGLFMDLIESIGTMVEFIQEDYKDKIRIRAADVANNAMMIACVCGEMNY